MTSYSMLSIVKTAVLPKMIYRFEWSKLNLSMPICRIWQTDSKIMWKCNGPRVAKTTLKKKNTDGGLELPDFKDYYRATVIDNRILIWKQINRWMAQNSKLRNRHNYMVNWFWTEWEVVSVGKDNFSPNSAGTIG